MKHFRSCTRIGVVSLASAFLTISLLTSQAQIQSGQVYIKAVEGEATYSTGQDCQPLPEHIVVKGGTTIKTGTNGAVDLILQYNGTVLRLVPESTLTFEKLNKESAGEEIITETSVKLLAGGVVGSQRKLASPSTFSINTPHGLITIKGTEYYVRADGAVSTISGEVHVIYNLPGNQGSVQVDVPAGYSFNPATGKVVPTTSGYLQNIIAHINTVRNNAQVFKTGGATVVVKPENNVSPTKGNNGVGNGLDPQPPGNPPINDGPGTGPGHPGNKHHGTSARHIFIN